GLAAGGGDDEDVVVAVAVGGEGDPLAVGREARVGVAGAVDGEPLRARAVLVDQPQVAQVAEDDLAVVVIGVPGQPDRGRRGGRGQQTEDGEGRHPPGRGTGGLAGHDRLTYSVDGEPRIRIGGDDSGGGGPSQGPRRENAAGGREAAETLRPRRRGVGRLPVPLASRLATLRRSVPAAQDASAKFLMPQGGTLKA